MQVRTGQAGVPLPQDALASTQALGCALSLLASEPAPVLSLRGLPQGKLSGQQFVLYPLSLGLQNLLQEPPPGLSIKTMQPHEVLASPQASVQACLVLAASHGCGRGAALRLEAGWEPLLRRPSSSW